MSSHCTVWRRCRAPSPSLGALMRWAVIRIKTPLSTAALFSLYRRSTNTGVALSVYSLGEPRAGNADLGGVAALHHLVVSLTPFHHCFHGMPVSILVLLLVSRRRQRGMKKAGSSGPPHPSFFFGCHASESAALRAENLRVQNERLWISTASWCPEPSREATFPRRYAHRFAHLRPIGCNSAQ